jgi:hypothetical protein
MMSIVQRLSNLRPAYDAGQRILHPFRPGALPIAAPDVEQADQRLAATLLREGLVAPHQLIKALAYVKDGPAHRLVDVLLERNLVDEAQFFATLQRHTGYGRADRRLGRIVLLGRTHSAAAAHGRRHADRSSPS